MMNAPRGSRFILKTQQEVGVIQQLAVQDFERYQTVADRDLLGEEHRTHGARSQLADKPETARKTRNEMGVDLSHSGKFSARYCSDADRASLHACSRGYQPSRNRMRSDSTIHSCPSGDRSRSTGMRRRSIESSVILS